MPANDPYMGEVWALKANPRITAKIVSIVGVFVFYQLTTVPKVYHLVKANFLEHYQFSGKEPLEDELALVCVEQDPNGLLPSDPGAKLDKGKDRMGLIVRQFPRALRAFCQPGVYGLDKYSEGGWKEVEDGFNRYEAAEWRHRLKRWAGEEIDPDTGLPHIYHEAWNVMAKLEFYERQAKKNFTG